MPRGAGFLCSLGYAARPVSWWTRQSSRLAEATPRFFSTIPKKPAKWLRTLAQPGDAILFKGSRGTHVERALEEFLARDLADALLASFPGTVHCLREAVLVSGSASAVPVRYVSDRASRV